MERNGGMRRNGEKAKDFKGIWVKLLLYCKKYYAALAAAVLCAVIGTVFTLIGPDKLSEMTKVITDGLATGIDMDAIKKSRFYAGGVLCMRRASVADPAADHRAGDTGRNEEPAQGYNGKD